MSHASLRLFRLFLAAVLAVTSAPAFAAAQRTFVASTGSDANACSLVAPCRTFGHAITQTSAGGEVIVLDSGGYGPVTITQSVSIIAPPGIYAGISVFNTEGVYINNGSVVLRGLSIIGQGSNPNTNGIFVFDATEVHIEGCVISNLSDSGIQINPFQGQPKVFIKDTILRSNGLKGIFVANGDAVEVYVRDTVISRNGYGLLSSPPAGVSVVAGSATFDRVRIENNVGNGLEVRADSGAAVRAITFRDGVISGNSDVGALAEASTGRSHMTIDHSLVERNGAEGVLAEGGGTVTGSIARTTITNNASDGMAVLSGASTAVVVSGNTITHNGGCGLNRSSGVLRSRGDNTIADNGCVTSGTITPLGGF